MREAIKFAIVMFVKRFFGIDKIEQEIKTLHDEMKDMRHDFEKKLLDTEIRMFRKVIDLYKELNEWYKKGQENPYTAEEKQTLLRKVEEGTITYKEALRLQEILEEERREAQRKKDLQALFVITLLLLSLAGIIALLSKKSK